MKRGEQTLHIAITQEAEWFVARLMKPNGSGDSIELGRILAAMVPDESAQGAFVGVVNAGVKRMLKDALGVVPDGERIFRIDPNERH